MNAPKLVPVDTTCTATMSRCATRAAISIDKSGNYASNHSMEARIVSGPSTSPGSCSEKGACACSTNLGAINSSHRSYWRRSTSPRPSDGSFPRFPRSCSNSSTRDGSPASPEPLPMPPSMRGTPCRSHCTSGARGHAVLAAIRASAGASFPVQARRVPFTDHDHRVDAMTSVRLAGRHNESNLG